MPYTIPSSTITPGTVYQPRDGLPGVIKSNARAIYATGATAFNSTRMLDLLPSHKGARRTGEQGRAYTADGVDDEVNFGDIGTAIWFSGWVKLNSDNQCLFSLSNDTNTNVIVSAGVLTAGATLTLAGIKVDDVSKTASEAGALLNDNDWHFLSCGIGDGLGGASTADDVRFFTDGTNHGSVSGFDWRFWSTAPTAAELTEAYNGASANRNSADLSKYALWIKGDEQSGTTAYDSSGNGNDGAITNATLANFHSTQDIWSFQNQVGYNRRMYFDGVDDYVNFGSVGNIGVDCQVRMSFVTTDSGKIFFSQADGSGRSCTLTNPALTSNLTFYNANGNILIWSGNPNGIDIRDGEQHDLIFEKNGNDLSITIDGVTRSVTKAFADSGNNGEFCVGGHPNEIAEFEGVISDVKVDVGNNGLWDLESDGYGNTDADWIDTTGNGNNGTVTGSPSNIYLPRDEYTLDQDVLGNPLTYTGKRPNDAALTGSNCLTADGTLYIAAAHLTGSETVVSSGGTSTPSISAGRIDFTAGTCWDLTLSDGTHYPLSEGWGVDIGSSTSDNDGTLTSAILANAWGATQADYHYNLFNGFTLYEHATTAPIRWPYKNGSPKTLTPPTGYSKTSDNPAGNYHNNAETTIDFDPDSTPEMGATQLGITAPSAHGFGDAWAASDQTFSRQRTLTEDRFVIMPEVQTGEALTSIQRYTQP